MGQGGRMKMTYRRHSKISVSCGGSENTRPNDILSSNNFPIFYFMESVNNKNKTATSVNLINHMKKYCWWRFDLFDCVKIDLTGKKKLFHSDTLDEDFIGWKHHYAYRISLSKVEFRNILYINVQSSLADLFPVFYTCF